VSLLPVCEWLARTTGSTALRESLYTYPLVESIHVWTLAVFVGLAAILDLRLLGLALRQVAVTELAQRLGPWLVGGCAVMIVSGSMLFYAVPVRTYQSVWFRSKMVFLILAALNAWLFHSGVYRSVASWDLAADIPRKAKVAGAVSIVLWAAIIFSGRLIAYNWFDCDRQPQHALVNALAGCVVEPEEPVR
jgi:hypothetical protein